MKNRKFSKKNKDKKIHTIIEVRKEILTMLRDISIDVASELSESSGKDKVLLDVKEIAEMIKDKDRYIDKVNELEVIPKSQKYVKDSLIRETRERIKKLLKNKLDSIVATQYDAEELVIVQKEIGDARHLVDEKDRLVIRCKRSINAKKNSTGVNPYLKKYFNMDDGPDM